MSIQVLSDAHFLFDRQVNAPRLAVDGTVLVMFKSTRCPACAGVLQHLDAAARRNKTNVKYMIVDVHENPRAILPFANTKLEVKNVPTIMMFHDGAARARFKGNISMEMASIENFVNMVNADIISKAGRSFAAPPQRMHPQQHAQAARAPYNQHHPQQHHPQLPHPQQYYAPQQQPQPQQQGYTPQQQGYAPQQQQQQQYHGPPQQQGPPRGPGGPGGPGKAYQPDIDRRGQVMPEGPGGYAFLKDDREDGRMAYPVAAVPANKPWATDGRRSMYHDYYA